MFEIASMPLEDCACAVVRQTAGLGLLDRLEGDFANGAKPADREVTNAFWNACKGGQLKAARYLLAHGADRNWIGHNRQTPLEAAIGQGNEEVVAWLRAL